MNNIPKYKISMTALKNYRDGAKSSRYIDVKVLKDRINSLIYASEDVKLISNGKRFRFGSCNFDVDTQGIVVKIFWNENTAVVNKSEVFNLLKAYDTFGLNKSGTYFKKAQ